LYDLKVGQIAEKTIIAPFDFNIMKDKKALETEKKQAANQISDVYLLSEEIKYNAQKKLNTFFQELTNLYIKYPEKNDSIRNQLNKLNYQVSNKTIIFLKDKKRRSDIYDFISERMNYVMDIGIYPDDYRGEEIDVFRNGKTKSYSLLKLFSLNESIVKITETASDELSKNSVTEIIQSFLTPNIVYDAELTETRKEEVRNRVNPVMRVVSKNEAIIQQNSRITEDDKKILEILNTERKKYSSGENLQRILFASLSLFVFVLIITNIFVTVLNKYLQTSVRNILILLTLLLINIVLITFYNVSSGFHPLLIPSVFFVMVSWMFYSNLTALLIIVVQFFLTNFFLNWNVEPVLVHTSIALVGLYSVEKTKKKDRLLTVWLYMIITAVIVNLIFALLKFEGLQITAQHITYTFISVTISLVMMIIMRPWLERMLNVTSDQIFKELQDFNHPLLKKLAQVAPGTYHHSLNVGTLAETAAEAIGANLRVVRVGSYYHDIGKIDNPQIFIENNTNSSGLHEKMLPVESAVSIREHVLNGLALAKEYNLPQPVTDIIRQHHGESTIKYFYQKAIEAGHKIEKEKFQYFGPNPRSKEAVLVMVADIAESTAKSMKDRSERALSDMLDKTISGLIDSGILDDAPITLKELKIIKSCMFPTLKGFYGIRIEYPTSDN